MRALIRALAPDGICRAAAPAPRADARLGPRRGPGPSKLRYRMQRTWAKPLVRNAVLVYLPLAVLAITGWRVAADDHMRGQIGRGATAVLEKIAARPEFAVRGVTVTGGSTALQIDVHMALDVEPGTSSLKLDLDALRHRVEALGPVKRATVQFDPQGALRVVLIERTPVVLYRKPDDRLVLMDEGGVEIGPAGARARYPDLPVILGESAPEHVGEVLALLDSAPSILPRLRAFVRVGGRRWDLVLERDMLVKLPAEGSVEALSRVMALQYGEDLLDRDLAVIDMRLPERPALRMTPEAAETYQIRRAVAAAIGGEDT